MPTDLERSLDAIRAHAKKVVPKAAASLRRSAGATASPFVFQPRL